MLRHRLPCSALVLFVAWLPLSCSDAPRTPEQRVRAVLGELEEAAEARDVARMKEHVSERYGDARGNDKQAVGAFAAFHLLRNESIFLLTRVGDVDLATLGEARVEALVAMAGTPIDSAAALADVRADLWRFDLTLREEEPDTWRVTRAAWRPAAASDFLGSDPQP